MAKTKTAYTPKELAKETGVDAKRIRAYLRANFPRTAEAKNTSWTVSSDVRSDVIEHFEKPKAKTEESDES